MRIAATMRRLHSYIGMFIAPSVLFFTLTGSLQLFSLHEAHGDYVPLAMIEKLGSVHKDQVFELGHHHPPPAAATRAGTTAPPKAGDDDNIAVPTLLLKCFFLLVALSLFASTMLGLWIGLTRMSGRRTGLALLIAGAVIPLALLMA